LFFFSQDLACAEGAEQSLRFPIANVEPDLHHPNLALKLGANLQAI